MRQIRFILILAITTITVFSCNKESCEKSNGCDFNTNITMSGNVLTQNQQDKYFGIWKSLFMEKSNMTESYFNNHIVNYVITSMEWNAGTSFRIDYVIHIDWIDIRCSDAFLVKMNSSYDSYEYLNIPRDVFFEQSQIDSNIASKVDSEISYFNLLEKLKYKDCTELRTAIKDSSGYSVALPDNATYYVPGKIPREDGDPYVTIRGIVSQQNNKCLRGHINLKTGEWKVWEDACQVN